MKITVCSLHNGGEHFAADWAQLQEHVHTRHSDMVLLPEMPFAPWFPTARQFDAGIWYQAITAHDAWQARLCDLAPAIVLGTRPIDFGNNRYNAGFWWNQDQSIVETVHLKSRLSIDEGSWEPNWYEMAAPDFDVTTVGGVCIGMLIGGELWMSTQAKTYGECGAHLIAVPRVNHAPVTDSADSDDGWFADGCDAARASRAYCISSTRGTGGDSTGGSAWIIAPDGHTAAITSADERIVTADVALHIDAYHPEHDVAPWNRV